ncbi:MAG: redoxin domain-containing protein [Bacteroidia bacterium]
MKSSFLILIPYIFFLFISCNEKRTGTAENLFSFKLSTTDNSQYDFSSLKNNKASVFIFLASDCPLSQNYTLTLNKLQEQFKKNSIVFYGIIAGTNFNKKEVDDFVNKYKINFPVLLDSGFNLAAYFKASKTPEVFVVNPEQKILYKGAIDNWAADLGVHRTVITEHYLEDALTNIIQNNDVRIKETKAVGCFIEKKQ